MLADYAVRVEQSRGRRIPEPQHPYRNDFQRDRDRVIHSRAFRRLEAKTQVFTRRYLRSFSQPPDPHAGGGANRPHHRRDNSA